MTRCRTLSRAMSRSSSAKSFSPPFRALVRGVRIASVMTYFDGLERHAMNKVQEDGQGAQYHLGSSQVVGSSSLVLEQHQRGDSRRS